MLVLGVDIAARKGGSNCGLALINTSRITAFDKPSDDLMWAKSIDGTDLCQIAAAVRDGGNMLAIERQFMGLDPVTFEKLITARVRFETVAQIRGVAFELVYPKTWQASMFAVLGADAPMKPSKPRKAKVPPEPAQQVLVAAPKMIKDTKASARMLCSRLYPGVTLTGDQCDALLLARHVGWKRTHP